MQLVKIEITECGLEIDAVISDKDSPRGYLAGPLDGIWAGAPYLHNGSVPSLAQLLQPNLRVKSFYRGNIGYDTKEIGFEWQSKQHPYAVIYDTELSGYSNQGHSDVDLFFGGIDFEKDENSREALLEYLKTL